MDELVSIITPSYNTAMFIAETINSVLKQTYQNWEMIIADDCSTDNTNQVVAQFSDPRIIYLKNDKNSGAAVSRNLALKTAKGRWIAFLDSDDIWLPDKLEKQIRFMEKNEIYFSYTEYNEIDEKSNSRNVIVSGPQRISKTLMYFYCWPGCVTVMYDAKHIGLIQIEDIKKNNDYAMWLKAIAKAECRLLKEPLALYRKRQGSISGHSYTKLIKWHYRLFRVADKRNALVSMFLTVCNLAAGACKKIFYVKRIG